MSSRRLSPRLAAQMARPGSAGSVHLASPAGTGPAAQATAAVPTRKRSRPTLERGDTAAATARAARRQRTKDEQQRVVDATETNGAAKTDQAVVTKFDRAAERTVAHIGSVPTSSDFMWPGAHVSAAGGVSTAPQRALSLGCGSFALFVQNQRRFVGPPLADAEIAAFKLSLQECGYTPASVLPHGSYLVNLGNPDDAKLKKSKFLFLEELRKCEQLGLEAYNFHPGSTVGGCTSKDCLERIASCINWAHSKTERIVCVLENTAGAGNTVGRTLEELRDICDLIEDKSRVGVCIDTCHAFAAGYDLRTADNVAAFWEQFDRIVGRQYLRGMHLNDSKAELGSRRDLHANIGKGQIGLECFRAIMRDERLKGIPLILETEGPYDAELDLLRSLEPKTETA